MHAAMFGLTITSRAAWTPLMQYPEVGTSASPCRTRRRPCTYDLPRKNAGRNRSTVAYRASRPSKSHPALPSTSSYNMTAPRRGVAHIARRHREHGLLSTVLSTRQLVLPADTVGLLAVAADTCNAELANNKPLPGNGTIGAWGRTSVV